MNLIERLQHPEHANPIAVFAQSVVAQVRIGRRHATGRRKRLALLIQREKLQCNVDPQLPAILTVGPRLRVCVIHQHRPVVQVVVHAITAMRVLQIGLWV